MIIKKYLLIIIGIVGMLLLVGNSFGKSRQGDVGLNSNSQKKITFAEFDRRVDRATKLLQTKALSKISDNDHINIMMCLNTIFVNNSDGRFNGESCKKLLCVAQEKDYRHNIDKVYSRWLFNRGMGHYYPKIKMELYGTPMSYATFLVKN